MRICLKHKFGTFLINHLIRVVTYIGIWSIFHIAQTHLVKKSSILLTNLMRNNLGLKGNFDTLTLFQRNVKYLHY